MNEKKYSYYPQFQLMKILVSKNSRLVSHCLHIAILVKYVSCCLVMVFKLYHFYTRYLSTFVDHCSDMMVPKKIFFIFFRSISYLSKLST